MATGLFPEELIRNGSQSGDEEFVELEMHFSFGAPFRQVEDYRSMKKIESIQINIKINIISSISSWKVRNERFGVGSASKVI